MAGGVRECVPRRRWPHTTMIRASILLSVLLAAPPASAAAASLQMAPPSVPPGAVATAYGYGFCDGEGCSAVTIRMAGQVAASGVEVRPGGSFEAPVRTETAGRYKVTATQRLADGSTLSASTTLIVGGGDKPVASPDPTDEQTPEPSDPSPKATPSGEEAPTPGEVSPIPPTGDEATPAAGETARRGTHPLAWVLLALLLGAALAVLWRAISKRHPA